MRQWVLATSGKHQRAEMSGLRFLNLVLVTLLFGPRQWERMNIKTYNGYRISITRLARLNHEHFRPDNPGVRFLKFRLGQRIRTRTVGGRLRLIDEREKRSSVAFKAAWNELEKTAVSMPRS